MEGYIQDHEVTSSSLRDLSSRSVPTYDRLSRHPIRFIDDFREWYRKESPSQALITPRLLSRY